VGVFFKRDPGPCPVCQAPHTICTAPGPPDVIVAQLPARDAISAAPRLVGAVDAPEALPAALPPNAFSTGTYRRPGKKG
jgi:hypothetical protein